MTVDITLANPDPSDCPGTFEELVALFRTLISGSVTGATTPYVVQAATPTVDQQTFIWFKLDGAGRPVGIYKYYDGNWRRVYNGVASEVRMFAGDPSGVFDGTGKGLLGGDWDGWALMNGNNGTSDISDRFIIASHMDNATGVNGYDSGWRSTVDGSPEATGGNAAITLDASNTYNPGRPEIKVWKWSATGNTGRVTTGDLYGISSTPGVSVNLQDSDDGNPTPDPISIIPPFYAVAFCKFIGYA